MSKKQFCDFCGEKIDFECGCDVSIYDYIKEENESQEDICDECKKKILVFLKKLKSEEKRR